MEEIQELSWQSQILRHSKSLKATILFYLLVRIQFIIPIGDGVFDKLNNKEVIDAAWDAAKKSFKSSTQTIH
jgi:hypothetical protein